MHIGTADKVTDTDDCADAVIRETLEVSDEILARKCFLRHRALGNILEAEMTVQIDHCGHDGLAGQIDAHSSCRNFYLTASANTRELTALDDKHSIFDRCAAIAGN